MEKTVLVPIATGIEEIEAVCIIDVLRRAGASVTVASVEDELQITASRGVKIVADRYLADCVHDVYDLIALPGGLPGAERLRDSQILIMLLKRQQQDGRFYAAICASPVVVFQHHHLLDGYRATCHPSFVERLENREMAAQRVVIDGNCVTSRSPGTAIEFALTLVECLYDKPHAQKIADAMLAI